MDLDTILEKVTALFAGLENGPTAPDTGALIEKSMTIAKVLVIAGPLIMLILGLLYLFAAPREANHHFGYRCYFGMGSEQAWQFTQRIAGVTWIALGAVMTLVMLIVTARFPGQDVLEMLSTAGTCVVVEALVLLAATLVIRITVAACFDRHGERRRRK